MSIISSAVGGLFSSQFNGSSNDPPIPLPSDLPLTPVIPAPPLSSPPLSSSTSSSSDTNSSNPISTSVDTNSTSSTTSSSSSSSLTANSTSSASNSNTNLSRISSSPFPGSRLSSNVPFSSYAAPSFNNTGSSTLTEVYTSVSGSITVAITTTILPSLSSNPDSSVSFFKNKGQAAAIMTVLILVGILGFGFLGYRFVKTVKHRQLERDLQEATRLNRSRAILDDWDDDTYSVVSMQQVENSSQSALQPISPNLPSGNYRTSTSMKSSMSTFRDLGSFEFARPSRTFRSPVSPEEDGVLSADTKYSKDNISSDVYGSRSSNSTSNPFLDREYLQPPTPPVLPETFGEDTQPQNTSQSAESEDVLDYIRLMQRSLRRFTPIFQIANE
ncbi:hypothetical protein Clacol_001835 [Clathrus columnatus]|uniref:Uncharacterized protein n=1 Tax=Clathrus columnatus TaxID=1419009 RepID=A0AAV5A3N6_9AGAM|nr:hypothetical protein Clacol_001835 [Clathrus columnatus]